MKKNEQWLKWAVELQAVAQAGLFYGKDKFDIERYERIREIAAEMIAYKSDLSLEKVKDLFCCESGYQTPKIDTRAAIFKEGKILLVCEANGKWSLPIYAYKVCKIFMECEVLGGSFVENIETTGYAYFGLDELPELAEEKNNREQIEMCFRAMRSESWEALFD